ncbi:spermatogenesis-associated protein 9 isoform X4 [Bos javanicus]|uniref:spermatogenesis-associated protein 9 isoform X4 n=1 Tax=Bos javanicus TaxID=9906 RepID=UPI002AA5E48D|nr:spermatogenesis-associated protein 9 isoform X4 [Bos javanicus]
MVEEDGQCPGLQACCEVGTQHASQTCWVDMWAGVEELFWKKYAHYSCEGDRVEGIQKVIMDLIDEFKDEFPTILRLSQSNQKREPMQKPSKIRMAIALAKINRGTLIQGLNSISRSSKSVAKLLQPQLACRLLELRAISHRLLKEVNAPRQPLYNIQVKDKNLKKKDAAKQRVIFLACRPHFYFYCIRPTNYWTFHYTHIFTNSWIFYSTRRHSVGMNLISFLTSAPY